MLRHPRAGSGSPLNQPFGLQGTQCLTNDVAGGGEFGGQLQFPGQSVAVGTAVDLVAQDVGDLPRPVRAADRLCCESGFGHADTLKAQRRPWQHSESR